VERMRNRRILSIRVILNGKTANSSSVSADAGRE
jgi:hypothetical protein